MKKKFEKYILFNTYSIKKSTANKSGYDVYLVDHSRIQSLYGELHDDIDANEIIEGCLKRKCEYILYSFFF